jgi:hypothetical protein
MDPQGKKVASLREQLAMHAGEIKRIVEEATGKPLPSSRPSATQPENQ